LLLASATEPVGRSLPDFRITIPNETVLAVSLVVSDREGWCVEANVPCLIDAVE